MGFDRVRQHHIFQHAAFLADLQFAVAVGALKVMMHIEQQFANVGVFEAEFFREHQRAARIQPLIDFIEDRLAIARLKELNSKVQDHQRGVFNGHVADIPFNHFDRRRRFISVNMATAALHHRGRVIDGDNATARMANIAAHGEGGGAQRTAKIVNLSVGLNEALGQHADHRDDIGVAGHRTLDHIGEDFSNPFIKGPVAEAGNRRGKKRIAVRHNVKPEKTKTAYCALTEGENQLPGHIPKIGQHH